MSHIQMRIIQSEKDPTRRPIRKVQDFFISRISRRGMAETKVLINLKGVPASVHSKLVEKGYYSTKS